MGQAISCLSADGRTLLTAANDGDFQTVRQILAQHVELAASAAFPKQRNCLHYAAAQGHIRVLETVLTILGSDSHQQQPAKSRYRLRKKVINQKSSKGQTPLTIACETGHAFCARYLIEQGADIYARDKSYRLALHHAAANGREHVLKVLLDDSMRVATHDGHVALRNARRHGNSCNCRYINSRAENGLTALHLAAFSGRFSCVQLLLAAGADVMAETVDQGISSIINMPAGSTVLHAAVASHQVSIVQAVLKANADAMSTHNHTEAGAQGNEPVDLRLLGNIHRQAPSEVAWESGFRAVVNLLQPAVPMARALRMCTDSSQGFGPPTLKVIAGAALRQHLLNCCEAIKDAFVEHDHQLQPAGIQTAELWFNGVLVNLDIAALGLGQAFSKAVFEKEALSVDDAECGICMDSITQLAIDPCEHELCTDCLVTLCQQQSNPPSCPFCRQMICGVASL